MHNSIAVMNTKGGVGKSTIVLALAETLSALHGKNVLVIDSDAQASVSSMLMTVSSLYKLQSDGATIVDYLHATALKGEMAEWPKYIVRNVSDVDDARTVYLLPSDMQLTLLEREVSKESLHAGLRNVIASLLSAVRKVFDVVIIDCPPSLGLITVNGLAAADEVLVPIQCEYYALEGLSQLLRNVNLVSTNLNQTLEVSTIVLTMYDARTRLSVDVANEVREHFSERVCRAVIPRTVRLSEAPSFGQPITVFDPASRGAVAYRELAKEVSNGAPQRSR